MTKTVLNRKQLSIKKSSVAGYGVFAEEAIAAGDLIEECHALLTTSKYSEMVNYLFKTQDAYALALGHGSIFNHHSHPNARYYYDEEQQLVIFHAQRSIRKGEEIFVSYGENWFSSRDLPVKKPSWRYLLRKQKPFLRLFVRAGIVLIVMAEVYLFLYSTWHK